MKIAVSGTHSTGKTIFLTRLRHLLETAGYHVSTVGDQAAAARDHGFPILREQTGTTTLWIMTTGIAAELAAGRRADVVLVDRPITTRWPTTRPPTHRGASQSTRCRRRF